MLEPEDRAPQLARVMKITSSSSSPARPEPVRRLSAAEKVPNFEEDYTESTSDSDDEPAPAKVQEESWNVVASKKSKPVCWLLFLTPQNPSPCRSAASPKSTSTARTRRTGSPRSSARTPRRPTRRRSPRRPRRPTDSAASRSTRRRSSGGLCKKSKLTV